MSRLQNMIGILGFVVVLGMGIEIASGQCPAAPTDYDCECNGDETRWFCAKWDGPVPPVEGLDFTVTYTGDIPAVVFATGDPGWVLYSEALDGNGDPKGPADIGAITLDPTVSSDDFELSIKNGAGVGAADVASLVLDDAGFTGYSNLIVRGT